MGQRTAQGAACRDPQSPLKEGWGTRGLPSSFFFFLTHPLPHSAQRESPAPLPHHNLSITASALPRLFVRRRPLALEQHFLAVNTTPCAYASSWQCPLHYHFTNFPLVGDNNASHYLPGDLWEAIQEKDRYIFVCPRF